MSIENEICKTIEMITTNAIQKADFDKTVLAKIVNCVDEETGKYKIKYQDSYSYAYSTSLDIKYNEGAYVYVQIPNNNEKNNKTILSAAENSSVDYGYSIDLEDEYDKLGENVISSNNYPFKISVEGNSKIILYDYLKNDNLINIDKNSFENNISNANAFLLAGNFQTLFEVEPQKGNYGLGIVIAFEINGEAQDILLNFSTTDMIGNPYAYYNSTRQYKIFNLNELGIFKQIKQIYFFVENFDIKGLIYLNKELELQAINKISEEELNGYSLKVIATQGNTFEGKASSDKKETRNFLSQIKYKGRVQKAETASYYWFRENSRIFSNSEKYCSYGGIGWECLNKKTSEEKPNWISENSLYSIDRKLVTAREVRFKCVVIYKENQLEKIFKIYNMDTSLPQLKIQIQRDNATLEAETAVFQNGIGYPTLTCLINNQEYPNYSYKWSIEDSFGITSNLVNNEEENFKTFFEFQSIVKNIQNLKEKFSLTSNNIYINRLEKIIQDYEKCSINENELIELTEEDSLDSDFIQDYNNIILQIKNFGNRSFVTYSKDFIINYYSLKQEILNKIKRIIDLGDLWEQTKGIVGKIEYPEITLEQCFNEISQKINERKYNKEIYNSINQNLTILQSKILSLATEDISEIVDILYDLNLALDNEIALAAVDYYGNKVYNYKVSEVINYNIIKCSVLNENDDYIGTVSFEIKNNQTQISNSLILNNGNQIYQYNESGVSPTDSSNENPLKIKVLSFNFYTNTGENISFSSIVNNGFIKWKIPLENTLIQCGLEEESEETIENGIRYKVYKNINSLTYSLKQIYKETQNNDIILEILYKNESYYAKTNFTFLKQGELGTSGTPYTCRIIPNAAAGTSIPQYPIFSYKINSRTGTFNFYNQKTHQKWIIGTDTTDKTAITNDFPFLIEIYENNSLTYKGSLSGESAVAAEGEKISYTLDWSFLCNLYKKTSRGTTFKDYSTFEIKSQNNIKYLVISHYDEEKDREDFSTLNFKKQYGMADILKCQITRTYTKIDGTKETNTFYATLPIVTLVNETKEPNLDLIIKNGFQFVQYNSNGLEPKYKNLYPFELNFLEKEKYEFTWGRIGSIKTYVKDGGYPRRIDYYLEIQKVLEDGLEISNKIYGKPLSKYDGLNVTGGISCLIKNQKEENYLFIPIHCYLNRYSFNNLNGWDGNSLQINEEGGFILTPQIAAGQKNNDNSFTGLVMGKMITPDQEKEKIGLLGLSKGQQSLFLNAQTGQAAFGLVQNGQLLIDPSQNQVLLSSSNAWKNVDENGFPTDISDRNRSDTGLVINLTNSTIDSVNFKVDSQGKVKATNAVFEGEVTATTFNFAADNKITSSITSQGFTIIDNQKKIGYIGELGIEGRTGKGILLNCSPDGRFSGIGHLDKGKILSTPVFYWCKASAFRDGQREGLYAEAPLYIEQGLYLKSELYAEAPLYIRNGLYSHSKNRGLNHTTTINGVTLFFEDGILVKVVANGQTYVNSN